MKQYCFFFLLLAPFFLSAQSDARIDVTVRNGKGNPSAGDKIYFVGQISHRSISGISNQDGQFRVLLPQGEVYDIRIQSIGEETDYNTIEIPTLGAGQQFENMSIEITCEPATDYTLKSLQFETGKALILSSSFPMLNELADLLLRKPNLKIGVFGHTDSEGDDVSNLKLSQQRADAVKDYLVKKGVPGDRIKALGCGEYKPIADNKTEKGRAANRRTEVRVF